MVPPLTKPEQDAIKKAQEHLDLKQDEATKAMELLRRLNDHDPHLRAAPESKAAGAVDIGAILCGSRLNHEEIADALGVHKQTVGRYSRMVRRLPRVDVIL